MAEYDDEMTERATFDFLCQATREGRPDDYNPSSLLSRRFGNLVEIYGMSGTIAYYRVFKDASGLECVCLLDNPSDDYLFRLVRQH